MRGGDKMDEKTILLLASDALLLELDENYIGVPKETHDLIYSILLEGYGLTVTSSEDEIKKLKELMINDVRNYRDKLINQL